MTRWLDGAGLASAAVVVARPRPLGGAERPVVWGMRLRDVLLGTADGPAMRWIIAFVAAMVVGVVGLIAAGPVAAVVSAAYSGTGLRALRRRTRMRADLGVRAANLDALGGLAADLRAGLPLPAISTMDRATDPLSVRTRAAVSLAESTGVPLADLLDRIEADARAADRTLALAAAQCAGARATALLLAGLPIAGIALGYAIGADPLHVLLHTPLGAACALSALVLQLAGLGWSARLVRLEVLR